jgi:hypothetical protein
MMQYISPESFAMARRADQRASNDVKKGFFSNRILGHEESYPFWAFLSELIQETAQYGCSRGVFIRTGLAEEISQGSLIALKARA